MQTNLVLAKTEMFGAVQCDFYQNESGDIFMTGEQRRRTDHREPIHRG